MTVTGAVAEFLQDPPDIPEHASNEAHKAAVDTLGVALAGWNEPASKKVHELEMSLASSTNSGMSLWRETQRLPADVTAMINGTASHALDYDDLLFDVTVHPSGSLWSASLGIGEYNNRNGEAIRTAYILGLEVLVRIGQQLGFRHYDLGWHATSTLGVLGTTTAAGYLLRLEFREIQHALGIASSSIGGLRRNFGSMVKPLHMGLAARQGVRAALLAAQGFTADEDVFDTGGFARAFTGAETEKIQEPSLGTPYHLEETGLSRKKYPCCYATHRLIKGGIQLRNQGVQPDSIETLDIVTPPGNLSPVDHPRPENGLQAKFSAEYTVAEALLRGDVRLDSFRDQHVNRDPVQRLLRKIKPVESDESTDHRTTLKDGEVDFICSLESGETIRTNVSSVPGSPQDPMTDEEINDKFHECFQWYLARSGNPRKLDEEKLQDTLWNIGEVSSTRVLFELPSLKST